MKKQAICLGAAKDIIGDGTLSIPDEINTVSELKDFLKERYPEFNTLSSLMIAINHEYAIDETSIGQGDEIAIIPPVSGG